MTLRTLSALALLDRSTPQQLADAVLTYRALGLAALDSLADAYGRIAVLERQLSETRAELTRYTRERVA